MVVKFRGRMVPICIIRLAGTATVINRITMAILVNFLIVTLLIVDGFPVVRLRGWLVVTVSGFRVVGLTVEVITIVTATITATIIAVLVFVVSVVIVVAVVTVVGHVDWVDWVMKE